MSLAKSLRKITNNTKNTKKEQPKSKKSIINKHGIKIILSLCFQTII